MYKIKHYEKDAMKTGKQIKKTSLIASRLVVE